MIQRVLLTAIIFALLFILLGCSSATPAPTAAPAGETTIRPTSTIAPLPPQPTTVSLAPRTPSPFVSPTPAVRISPTGGASSPVAAAATNPPPTAAPAATQPATSAGPVPTAPGVATGKRSEIKLAFLTPLNPAEEAEPAELVAIRNELKKVNGFMDISGDENLVTVGYDAGLITPEQLIQKFADLKHPVKRQA